MAHADIQLIVFDMEGTLTTDPTLWELMHLKTGTWESHGQPYWEQFKAGAFGYDAFARMDVATWNNAPVALLDEAVEEVSLMDGCSDLMAHLAARGIKSAIVSNGLERLGLRLAGVFGMDRVAANREETSDGHLTGQLDVLVPFEEKADAMVRIAAELGIVPENVMAVGDGIADVAMFRAAGTSVAFLPENETVAAEADYVVRMPDLRQVMPLIP